MNIPIEIEYDLNCPPSSEEYYKFLAECFQKEDIYWNELFEEMEAEYWINEFKNEIF